MALGWTLAESSSLDWVATNHCAPGARMPIAGKESGSNFPCFGGWGGVMKYEDYDVVIFSAFLEAFLLSEPTCFRFEEMNLVVQGSTEPIFLR